VSVRDAVGARACLRLRQKPQRAGETSPLALAESAVLWRPGGF